MEEFKNVEENKGNSSSSTNSNSNIRVVCRFRPQSRSEEKKGGKKAVQFADDGQTVQVIDEDDEDQKYNFSFDKAFNELATQELLYDYVGQPVVNAALQGYNGTVLAYGQTSSGKTYTMEGSDVTNEADRGLIPRMIMSLFDGIAKAPEHIEYKVSISMVEIYMEKVNDLLDITRNNLQIREDPDTGIWVEGAKVETIQNPLEILGIMKTGQRNRSTASTKMNRNSSRSHSLFMVNVKQRDLSTLSTRCGKLYLVDLAGSEKVRKTGASGTRLEEAKMINKSLSMLGNVINSLTDGTSAHIPYRDSKLTRILQESLGGNSKTALVVCCSPSSFNFHETLSSLRFGSRAKLIKNDAKINQEFSIAELKVLLHKAQNEISNLRQKLGQATSVQAENETCLETRRRELEEELQRNRAELEKEKLHTAEQHAAVKALEAELGQVKEEFLHSRNSYTELVTQEETKVNALMRENEAMQETISSLMEKSEGLEQRVKELETMLDQKTTQQLEEKEQRNKQEKEFATLQQLLEESRQSAEANATLVEQYIQALAESDASNTSYAAEIEKLHRESKVVAQQNAEMLEKYIDALTQADEEARTQCVRISELEKHIEELEKAKGEVMDALSSSRAEAESTQARVQRLEEELQDTMSYKSIIAEQRAELEQRQMEISTLKESEWKAEENLKQAKAHLERQLEAKEKEFRKALEEQTRQTLVISESEKAKMEEELELYKQQNNELEQQLMAKETEFRKALEEQTRQQTLVISESEKTRMEEELELYKKRNNELEQQLEAKEKEFRKALEEQERETQVVSEREKAKMEKDLELYKQRCDELERHIENQIRTFTEEMNINEESFQRKVANLEKLLHQEKVKAEQAEMQINRAKELAKREWDIERAELEDRMRDLKRSHLQAMAELRKETAMYVEKLQVEGEHARRVLVSQLEQVDAMNSHVMKRFRNENQSDQSKEHLGEKNDELEIDESVDVDLLEDDEETKKDRFEGGLDLEEENEKLKTLLRLQQDKLSRREQRLEALEQRVISGCVFEGKN